MDLTGYVDNLRRELAVAAEAGGDDARALAERLTLPLDSAVRLTLLDALSVAADEITRDLAPGSVELRLRGREPEFVVDVPSAEPAEPAEDGVGDSSAHDDAIMAHAAVEDGPTSRINVRLPDQLKARIEEAAGQEGRSVNAWLVRAAVAALEPAGREHRTARPGARGAQRYTGWVR